MDDVIDSLQGNMRGTRHSRFGQTGDLPDLYRTYRLDAEAIVDAMAELFVGETQ
jgi:pyruvate dehydrogenase E1 component